MRIRLKKPSKMRLFIQLHILVYGLLLVLWGMSYFDGKSGEETVREEMGFQPKKLRRATIVKEASSSGAEKRANSVEDER